MALKKILFICGTLNQTSMMVEISRFLSPYDCYFTPFYSDGPVHWITKLGLGRYTVLGRRIRKAAHVYLVKHECRIDDGAQNYDYDLVVTCSDLILPRNIKHLPIVLVQEGMTDPENWKTMVVKWLKLPRILANTSMSGLSNGYKKFCVASEGWKKHFIGKGCEPGKIVVTGIPNFDNVELYRKNEFPHTHFVLVATSHLRETYKYENRRNLIKQAVETAAGRKLIFKLHPSENRKRAIREIKKYAPDSLIFTDGDTNHMIANCDLLITRYSSVILVALALGKEVISDLDDADLQNFIPVQNQGRSGAFIADECRSILTLSDS